MGRRNPAVPVFAGFEKEDKGRILEAFPTAFYRICELECTDGQKKALWETIQRDYQKRFRIHYAVLGLPFLLAGIPFISTISTLVPLMPHVYYRKTEL